MTNWPEILKLAIAHAHKTGQRPYVFGAPDGAHWLYYFCRHDVHQRERPCPYHTIVRLQPARDR